MGAPFQPSNSSVLYSMHDHLHTQQPSFPTVAGLTDRQLRHSALLHHPPGYTNGQLPGRTGGNSQRWAGVATAGSTQQQPHYNHSASRCVIMFKETWKKEKTLEAYSRRKKNIRNRLQKKEKHQKHTLEIRKTLETYSIRKKKFETYLSIKKNIRNMEDKTHNIRTRLLKNDKR